MEAEKKTGATVMQTEKSQPSSRRRLVEQGMHTNLHDETRELEWIIVHD